MYVIETARYNCFRNQEKKDIIEEARPLIKEIFGYTDNDINNFIEKLFYPPLAIDITWEQAKQILKPFYDNNSRITIFVAEYDSNYKLVKNTFGFELGLTKEHPKEHYYDEPVVRKNQLVDPLNPPRNVIGWYNVKLIQPKSKPTITCPYCQSTNTKKITNASKAVHTALFGIFSISRNSKQWKCSDCGSEF